MLSKPTPSEIIRKVDISIGKVLENDQFLLEIGVHERTVAHKLAEYLQLQFQYWHVDCEYNRDKHDVKKIIDLHNECKKSGDTVFPDIIIHERDKKNNLLVIEMKTNTKETECDINKLMRFTKDKKFQYSLGLFLQLERGKSPLKKWFCNGDLVTEESLKKYTT